MIRLSRATKTVFLSALLVSVLGWTLATFLLLYFWKEQYALTEALHRSAVQAEEVAQLDVLEALAERTKEERENIQSFVVGEGETIEFLNWIESLGAREVSSYTTISVSEKESTGKYGAMLINASFSGTIDDVSRFVTLLEHAPYHITLMSLDASIRSGDESMVDAAIHFEVTLYTEAPKV